MTVQDTTDKYGEAAHGDNQDAKSRLHKKAFSEGGDNAKKVNELTLSQVSKHLQQLAELLNYWCTCS